MVCTILHVQHCLHFDIIQNCWSSSINETANISEIHKTPTDAISRYLDQSPPADDFIRLAILF